MPSIFNENIRMAESNHDNTAASAQNNVAVDGNADTAMNNVTSSEEISSGARRLARELREFITSQQAKNDGSSNLSLKMQYGNLSLSSEENIVDLQLAICRKLREVSQSRKLLLNHILDIQFSLLLHSYFLQVKNCCTLPSNGIGFLSFCRGLIFMIDLLSK